MSRDDAPWNRHVRLEWNLDAGRVVPSAVPVVAEAPADAEPDFVALDFETANEHRGSVCAVGIARVQDGRVVHRESHLVRPPDMRFNGINISIHGIRPEDVEHAPTFDRLWPTLEPILRDRVVLAHNAGFDISVLRHVLDAYGIRYPRLSYLCTVQIARRVWPRLPDHKLNTVAGHLGLSLRHHDAEDDAVACADIALHASRAVGAPDLEGLLEHLAIRPGTLSRNGYVRPGRRKPARDGDSPLAR